MKNTLFYLFLILIFSSSCSVQKALENEVDFIINEVNVVDVVNGEIHHNQSVAIVGNKIVDIYEESAQAIKAAKIINASGQYLIPGLWDMHAHYSLTYTFSNPLLIANGVTGIREMWGLMDTIQMIRTKTIAGKMTAPDIYSAGNIIDGNPPIWPGSVGAGNPEEVEKELDSQIAAGVDFFKVYSLLKKDTYHAIAKKSKAVNIPFAGHIPDEVSVWEAIAANQQSMEHMYGILRTCSNDPDSIATFTGYTRFGAARTNLLVDSYDAQLFDSLANALANSNTWLSPTLSVLKNIATMDDTTKIEDPRMAYMPPHVHYMWNPKNDFRFKYATPDIYQANQRRFQFEQQLVGQLAKAGVKIIAGTDYSNPFCYPGFSLHDELSLLVEGGLSPAHALKAATYNPAVFMKKEKELGQVAIGQIASLVLLEKNPLDNISHTKSINGVFLRGQYFDRAQLDALLLEAKRIAAKTENPFGN